jgi:hypothetical protein
MKLFVNIFFLFLICLTFRPVHVRAQSLPVGTPGLEDFYRRAQLLGKIDSTISFTSRPFYPVEALGVSDPFNPVFGLRSEKVTSLTTLPVSPSPRLPISPSPRPPLSRLKSLLSHLPLHASLFKFELLPITWQQQFNTDHPYSLNDGAMIPARGYQTMISGGFFVKYGILSIRLQPEYVYAQNKNFQGFYNEQPDGVWAGYYGSMNNIDLPEKFGNGSYKKLFWGQSSIRLTYGCLSLGLSNENLWWGPGMRNSLLMGNSAPGFKHLTLNTVKPIRSKFGSFEGQLIAGRLETSGFPPTDTILNSKGRKYYIPKRDDWRYLNAVVISWQPKWVPGLFLGGTRSMIVYNQDIGNHIENFLSVITPLAKGSNYGENESARPNDQRLSVFSRWVLPKAKAELYVEYLREDHAFDLRDIILQIEHTHAYLFGLRKLFPLVKKDQFIQLNLELTKLEQTGTNPERPQGSIYLHYAGIPQGYTHLGQLLGAAIGPGSDMQSISVSWVKTFKTFGVEVERFIQNNDFHNTVIKDPRANWVDLGFSAFGNWDWKNLLVSAKLEMIKSYNYQHLYKPIETDNPTYWTPGVNVYNFQGNLSVSYRF